MFYSGREEEEEGVEKGREIAWHVNE